MTLLTEEQLEEIYKLTNLAVEKYGQRAGQALFNSMEEITPQIAARIRGRNNDPFYNSSNINACLMSIVPIELQEKYIHQFLQLI